MPDPIINLEQVRTNTVTGFEVANTILSATDIPTELFVYQQADNVFSHVATLFDFVYPIVNTPSQNFYRLDNATREYTDVVTALEFANHVKFRLEALQEAYVTDFVDFPGTFNFVIPTP